MKQNSPAKKLRGGEGFDSYYSDIFGERWTALRESLLSEPDYAEWNAGGSESYFLDSGSVRAALALPLSGAERILDMCAAPGGKTVVMASCMDKDAVLVSNERSPERKNRLARSVSSCLPPDIQERITVTCRDGARLCLDKNNQFDRILLDAPCSSERHVLSDPKYLDEWSPSRIKTLSMAQWALLSSAYRMLVPGGYILYSTCALSPAENDLVISRLLKKFADASVCEPVSASEYRRFCSAELPSGSKTEYGCHILPDTDGGAGPLYFCLIHRHE